MANHYELIYTSVPRGLRAGSQGFCTVATTANMPTGLIGPLESLSAYRHIDAAVRPVNFSHVRMKVAGRNIDVISRVGDAGADYTGRTNKIAHHIVVDAADRPPGGPAALLLESDLTLDAWNRDPGELPPLASLPQVDSHPRVAQRWAAMTGDAGWAGHVAAQLVGGGPTIWLVYRPDQNAELLAMIDESLSILSPSQRWDATFATYCGDVGPGVTVRLRCVLAGSPEAASAAAHGSIDLASGSLGSPPDSPYVDAARRGVAVETLLARDSVSTSTAATTTNAAANATTNVTAPDTDDSFTLQPLPPPTAGVRPPHRNNAVPPALGVPKTSRSWLLPVTAVVLLLVLTGAGGAFWVINEQRQNDSLKQLTQQSENASNSAAKSAQDRGQIQDDDGTEAEPTIAAEEQPMDVEDHNPPESTEPSPEMLEQARAQLASIEKAKNSIIETAKNSIIETAKKLWKTLEELQAKQADLKTELDGLNAEYHTLDVYLYLSGSGNNTSLRVEMRCELANKTLSECTVKLADVDEDYGRLIGDEHRVIPNQQLYLVRDNDSLVFKLKPGGGDAEFTNLALELVEASKPVISQFDKIKESVTALSKTGISSDLDASAEQRAPHNVFQLVQRLGESLPEFNHKQIMESLEKSTNEIMDKVTLKGDAVDSKEQKNLSDSKQDFKTRLDKELKGVPTQISETNTAKPMIRSVAEQLQRYLGNRDEAHEKLKQLLDEKLIDFEDTLIFSKNSDLGEFNLLSSGSKEEVERFELVFIPKFHYKRPPQ